MLGEVELAPQLSEEQVKMLNQAGISFVNNAWAKVTPLPSGGYSVMPVML
jgi:hypothetical protein